MPTDTLQPRRATPALWNPKQAGDYLGWTQRRLEYAVANGRIPTVRVGSRYYFSPDALRHWIENGGKR